MRTTLLIFAGCVLLAGCDYTVPRVSHPETDVDHAIVGLWQRSRPDGTSERLLVLPLSRTEYLVMFPAESENAMFARACLWNQENTAWVQLNWFGTAQGRYPTDNRTFQYASYAMEDGKLTLQLLNPDVVPKDIASSEALAKAITDQRGHPNLFRPLMVFRRALP